MSDEAAMGSFPLGETLSVLCALVWAFAVVLYRKSGDVLKPLTLNVFKTAVGVALFGVSLLMLGVPVFPTEVTSVDWLLVIGSGVLGVGVADTLFFAGLTLLGPNRIAIVDCSYSPSVVLFAVVFLDEPLKFNVLASLALVVAALLVGLLRNAAPGTPGGLQRGRLVTGTILGILAVMLTAGAVVAVKPVLARAGVWWVSFVRLSSGLMVVLRTWVLAGGGRRARLSSLLSGRVLSVALPASVLGTYVGFLLWMAGMKYAYASVASILNQLSNIFVFPVSWLLIGEKPVPRQWIAIIMGVCGAALAVL